MIKIQYQGMNLLDQIATVEIAYDALNNKVHLYDPSAVVWPEYRGKGNGYVVSDGFQLMIKVLGDKPFFQDIEKQNDSEWLHALTWYFYKPNVQVLRMVEQQIAVVEDFSEEALNEQFLINIKQTINF